MAAEECTQLKPKLLPPFSQGIYNESPLTVSQFMDSYSKGLKNLSDTPCPPCLMNTGFFAPPDSYREHARTPVVEQYLNLQHWTNRKIFHDIVLQVRKALGTVGISIALIHKEFTYVKYETMLDFKKLPRMVSIDAHTILSKGSFTLRDASKDWRTAQNPFVAGAPSIRFYSGVNLIASTGDVIGVLAVFSALPKPNFASSNIKHLTKIADKLMKILDTPYDQFFVESGKKLVDNFNSIDVELAHLTSKLGRATFHGGHMAIFEKDGSGSAYSRDHIFRLLHYEEDGIIAANMISKLHRNEIRQNMKKAKNIKDAFKTAAKSILSHNKFDFVTVVEIRFIEQYTISRADLPDNSTKAYQRSPQKFRTSVLKSASAKSEKCQIRALASCGGTYDILATDLKIWQEAFSSESGYQISSATSDHIFNFGVIFPFFESKPNVIRNSNKGAEGSVSEDIILRSGGYLLGAFNKTSGNSHISATTVSKMHNHVQIACKLYLRK